MWKVHSKARNQTQNCTLQMRNTETMFCACCLKPSHPTLQTPALSMSYFNLLYMTFVYL